MKLLFASDLHGDFECAKELIDTFNKEKADRIVFCGDLLYHGPRNDLPRDYNPKKVIEILNENAENIISVRGNCDTEVDQMVLDFPVLSDYLEIYDNNLLIFVSHGHLYNLENPLKMKKGSVFVSGHTHILKAEEIDGMYYLNPGSVSIPKENNPKSYMIYENRKFTIKTFDGEIMKTVKL